MIPRLKPALGYKELVAAFTPTQQNAIAHFENAFAGVLGTNHAIAYSYGRSALWAFFKASDLHDVEVVIPAYTCSVVAHAIVLSGNIPRFVDIDLTDYNMNLEALQAAITPKTRAVVATHLFGYPMDIYALKRIIEEAEGKYGHKIWLIQDCAHSFGAEWQGEPVHLTGDIAIFGLNISKTITSVFGGMLTTQNTQLAQMLREWRNKYFSSPQVLKGLRRRLYLMALYPAFSEFLYGIVYWLQENTTTLKGLTDAYHLDEKIHFPPDYLEQLTPIEAQIGLLQTKKYEAIITARRQHAQYYNEMLIPLAADDFILPPLVDGATYSHYVIRVKDRDRWIKQLARQGVQLGILIEYSVPQLSAYQSYVEGQEFPHSDYCSQHMINVPIYPQLSPERREDIARKISKIRGA